MTKLEEKVCALYDFLKDAEQQSYSMVEYFNEEGDKYAYERWRAKWAAYVEILNIVREM